MRTHTTGMLFSLAYWRRSARPLIHELVNNALDSQDLHRAYQISVSEYFKSQKLQIDSYRLFLEKLFNTDSAGIWLASVPFKKGSAVAR
jgi:hypothetical protein